VKDVQEAARAKAVQLTIVKAGTESEIDAAMSDICVLIMHSRPIGGPEVISASCRAERRECWS
jgi:hypothetical protein